VHRPGEGDARGYEAEDQSDEPHVDCEGRHVRVVDVRSADLREGADLLDSVQVEFYPVRGVGYDESKRN
jgi:hypothetical protein